MANKKVGLALGSGGARGYAHLGVINVLKQNNIPIDFISGTSIGAIVGAYYALNLNVDALVDTGMNFKKTDWTKYFDINNPVVSLIKGNKLKNYVKQFLGNKTFKDTKIPLRIPATSIDDGTRVVFDSGKLIEAAWASSCIPGVFPPYKYRRKNLVDGGLADGLPVDLVKKMGADIIIGVDLYNFNFSKAKDYNSLTVLDRTYQMLISKLSFYQEHEFGKEIILIRPKTNLGMDTFAFDKAKQYIKAGEEEAKRYIFKIKRMLK